MGPPCTCVSLAYMYSYKEYVCLSGMAHHVMRPLKSDLAVCVFVLLSWSLLWTRCRGGCCYVFVVVEVIAICLLLLWWSLLLRGHCCCGAGFVVVVVELDVDCVHAFRRLKTRGVCTNAWAVHGVSAGTECFMDSINLSMNWCTVYCWSVVIGPLSMQTGISCHVHRYTNGLWSVACFASLKKFSRVCHPFLVVHWSVLHCYWLHVCCTWVSHCFFLSLSTYLREHMHFSWILTAGTRDLLSLIDILLPPLLPSSLGNFTYSFTIVS